MKNAVDHGTCDKITDGGGDSEAQVPVSSLICPVARFFCQRTQGLCEGDGLPVPVGSC